MENTFYSLNENELQVIDGGGFWSGFLSIAGGMGVSLAACVAVITLPLSVPVTLACCGAYSLGKLAVGVGIIDIVSED